jgi:two-component system, NtrC family, nitrogen regulation sensor histidine kinase NtrY
LRELSHDRRIQALALLSGLPAVVVALVLLWSGAYASALRWTATTLIVAVWLGAASAARGRVVRPLQTLSNMLSALREGDFSIRARVRVRDARDPLSLVHHEVNQLEDLLKEQRLGALEAGEILRKVLEEIDVAILAFDDTGSLRLLNRAAERLLGERAEVLGKSARDLRLQDALDGVQPRTVELSLPGGSGRWELRRGVIRQEGLPLRLIVLSDLSRALREEERQAWKRIIRVLSHEINNSLAPIKSISGSLKSLIGRDLPPPDLREDVERGLDVIEARAGALGRFMAAYARLARLPDPKLSSVEVAPLVERVAALETHVRVLVLGGPPIAIDADPDQLEQLLINLIRNAAEAVQQVGKGGSVRVWWKASGEKLSLMVDDDGPGLGDTANLFVPFYTTKPGGSGIGLVLSRQIAEAHGGSLELEDRAEGGARAKVTLSLPEEYRALERDAAS